MILLCYEETDMLEKELNELKQNTLSDEFLFDLKRKNNDADILLSSDQIEEAIRLWNPEILSDPAIHELLKRNDHNELAKLMAPEKYQFSSASSVVISKAARYIRTKVLHDHDYFEIECALDGTAVHHSLLGDYRIEQNDIVLIPPHIKHDLDVVENGTIVTIGIRSSTFRTEFAELLKNNVGISSYFEKIMYGTFNSEVILRDSLDDFLIEMLLVMHQKQKDESPVSIEINNHLAACFIFHMFEKSDSDLLYDISKSSNIKVNLIKRYIYDHFEDVTLQDLSDHFHMSKEYISRYIKENLKENYSCIVQNARMEKAKELLIKTDLSVLEIAEQIGYQSQSHFIHVFHETCDTSPLQYRKKKRYE